MSVFSELLSRSWPDILHRMLRIQKLSTCRNRKHHIQSGWHLLHSYVSYYHGFGCSIWLRIGVPQKKLPCSFHSSHLVYARTSIREEAFQLWCYRLHFWYLLQSQASCIGARFQPQCRTEEGRNANLLFKLFVWDFHCLNETCFSFFGVYKTANEKHIGCGTKSSTYSALMLISHGVDAKFRINKTCLQRKRRVAFDLI